MLSMHVHAITNIFIFIGGIINFLQKQTEAYLGPGLFKGNCMLEVLLFDPTPASAVVCDRTTWLNILVIQYFTIIIQHTAACQLTAMSLRSRTHHLTVHRHNFGRAAANAGWTSATGRWASLRGKTTVQLPTFTEWKNPLLCTRLEVTNSTILDAGAFTGYTGGRTCPVSYVVAFNFNFFLFLCRTDSFMYFGTITWLSYGLPLCWLPLLKYFWNTTGSVMCPRLSIQWAPRGEPSTCDL